MARRYRVRGHVQGVFFRDSTRRVAEPLGIRGHAINLDDGDVEVLAIGTREALASLSEWLEAGPPAARVTGIDEQAVDIADVGGVTGFQTG